MNDYEILEQAINNFNQRQDSVSDMVKLANNTESIYLFVDEGIDLISFKGYEGLAVQLIEELFERLKVRSDNWRSKQ